MELFQLRYLGGGNHSQFFPGGGGVLRVAASLSLQIANLEREVGAALFVRQGARCA